MNTRTRLATLALIPLTLAGAAACSTVSPAADAGPTSSSATSGSVAEATTSIAARITHDGVKVHSDPSDSAKVVTTLNTKTPLGSKTTLLAEETQGDWVKVDLPIRPNGSTGWVKSSDVELRTNTTAVAVDRAHHKLQVVKDGDIVLESTVAIGSDENPTPTGTFYITDMVDTGAPNGAYGPFAFGLSGHSETLTEFAGGDGQLGIHGTNEPASIGQSVSHGCVRVPNETVRQLVSIVPLGTPVTVV